MSMCGIAGYRCNKPVERKALRTMVDALTHRGPDSAGYHWTDVFGGGMRRLSINDLETGGQPLYDEQKSIVLFYNGEIYNAPELRRKLIAKGYRFRSNSDGEVICHLYRELGEQLFEQLDGMFAVALWVEAEKKLLLARDIPGEKPLYYARLSENEIVFASELKSLKLFPGLERLLNRQAIWDFPTFLWIPEPDTVYQGVHALPRGHVLVAENKGIILRPYKNRFADTDHLSHDNVVPATRNVIERAVHSRLLADVPVGSFLSGGLDSSIVATLAARKLGEINTFSVGFEDLADPYHGHADESKVAEAQALRIGSRHHAIHVTGDSFRSELDRFCVHSDQPFAVSSGLGIMAVARAASEEGVKVLLSGDGADECFGGYSWYPYLDWVRRFVPSMLDGQVVSFQNFGDSLSKRLGALAGYSAQEQAWAWHYYAHETEKASLFDPDWSAGLASSLRHFSHYKHETKWAPEDFIAQDRDFYFPNEMLTKVDRMTMAWSVEGRAPFAAPAVLAHAEKLKFVQMIRRGRGKWVLREAFKDVLPTEVLERPKHGFNVPIDHWLRNQWSDLVDEAFARDSALRRLGVVRADGGNEARRMLADEKRLNGHTVFCFIMLNRWLEGEGIGTYC